MQLKLYLLTVPQESVERYRCFPTTFFVVLHHSQVLIFISFRHRSINDTWWTIVNKQCKQTWIIFPCISLIYIVQIFKIPLQIIGTCIWYYASTFYTVCHFFRNLKSYFELHVKQRLKTRPLWTKIQFAEHNSV